ncbi:MAG: NAD(P)H-dependent oxidoreductase [Alphaproteobacteria bacterium]|nr:NAD(P)H-dependent oxidoreductase [Alphaproteobacteria bacterium]
MHVAIISGSHRPGGETHHIAAWFAAELQKSGHSSYTLNLAEANLPLWDEGMWGMGETAPMWKEKWGPISAELQQAEAFIILAPEYAGMVPATLKNFFLLVGGKECGHKPALICAITSSGTNGAYPVSELRASSYKNCKIAYLPEHLIFRHAGEILKAEVKPEFQSNDAYMQERARWCLQLLAGYATGLNAVRASGLSHHEKFPFGM